MSKFPARGIPLRTIGGLRYGVAATSTANLIVSPQRFALIICFCFYVIRFYCKNFSGY
ncbi:unnamed protein product [Haemonchus placei]|uniref:Uncharacterized protein n=1 Tax=Haemonchus placei TaxID=6290 RepID=A0A0N4WJH2_HAEPC|nr:unnamed protein product [Haemonchus placei]